jgi:hypothetical protein
LVVSHPISMSLDTEVVIVVLGVSITLSDQPFVADPSNTVVRSAPEIPKTVKELDPAELKVTLILSKDNTPDATAYHNSILGPDACVKPVLNLNPRVPVESLIEVTVRPETAEAQTRITSLELEVVNPVADMQDRVEQALPSIPSIAKDVLAA